VREGLKGNVQAIKELRESVEGKSMQRNRDHSGKRMQSASAHKTGARGR